jgi:NTP-dependent ternary system trypsin peptidase co-occuring protein
VDGPDRDIIDIDLGDGTVVPVEVDIEPAALTGEGRSDAGFRDWWQDGRRASLDRAAPTIRAMARWVHGQMAEIGAMQPDRVGVEMGVKFVARTPDLVAPVLGKVGGEATLLVRLEWDTARSGRGAPVGRPASDDDDHEESSSGLGG